MGEQPLNKIVFGLLQPDECVLEFCEKCLYLSLSSLLLLFSQLYRCLLFGLFSGCGLHMGPTSDCRKTSFFRHPLSWGYTRPVTFAMCAHGFLPVILCTALPSPVHDLISSRVALFSWASLEAISCFIVFHKNI